MLFRSVSRVASMSRPKGTADGQAVSHPRHCTHVSIMSIKLVLMGASLMWTWRIASIRPRGEYCSSPVTRKVGQCGRHNPQLTHVARWSSLMSNFIGVSSSFCLQSVRKFVDVPSLWTLIVTGTTAALAQVRLTARIESPGGIKYRLDSVV